MSASMPGMMDTILNLGLNDEAVEGFAEKTGNPRFAYDSYRRFIQMFSDVVMEVGKKYYLKETKAPKGYRLPTDIFGNPVVYEIWTESIPVQDRFVFYVNGEAYDTSSEGMFTVTGTKVDRHVGVTVVNVTLKKLPATGSELMIPTVVLALVLGFLSWKRR